MPTIAAADLSDSDQAELTGITLALAKFGCTPVTAADAEYGEWVRQTFPSWRKSDLFPFFLANTESPLIRPGAPLRGHILLWLSPSDSKDLDKFEAEPLADKGFLLVGFDRGGNYVAIDTGSESGLQVAMLDTGQVACYGVEEPWILRTGRDLGDFLEWVFAEPTEFLSLWKRHYSSPSDTEEK